MLRFRLVYHEGYSLDAGEHVFPWLRTLGSNGTTYSKHMEGAAAHHK